MSYHPQPMHSSSALVPLLGILEFQFSLPSLKIPDDDSIKGYYIKLHGLHKISCEISTTNSSNEEN